MNKTNKLNITVLVSDINGNEIIKREFATDYFDSEPMLQAIAETIEDADGYVCEDCWNTHQVDERVCHCVKN